MNKIIFDQKLMQLMAVFETITGAHLKDAVEDPAFFLFIVQPGFLARAVGKSGVNVKNLERKLNKRVKVVEYADHAATFARNLMAPAKVREGHEEEGVITLVPEDLQSRGYMIGRNASNLRFVENVVKRYFPIKEIKVGPA